MVDSDVFNNVPIFLKPVLKFYRKIPKPWRNKNDMQLEKKTLISNWPPHIKQKQIHTLLPSHHLFLRRNLKVFFF